MKKMMLYPFLLLLLPPIAHKVLDKDLTWLFEDNRPVSGAQRLEEIEGGSAGKLLKTPTLAENKRYRVQRGDTWWGIAEKHKIRDHQALQRYNRDVPLVPGIEVEIPKELVE